MKANPYGSSAAICGARRAGRKISWRNNGTKLKKARFGVLFSWSKRRESNPHGQLGKLKFCH